MTLERIQLKVRELHRKTRRELLGSWAGPLILVLLFSLHLKHLPDEDLRPLLLCCIAWSALGQYFLNWRMKSAAASGDAGLTGGLESYRLEVERRRALPGRVMLWSLAPILVALASVVFSVVTTANGAGQMSKAFPFLAMVILWIPVVFIIRMRQRGELRREIDELKKIEQANR